MITSKNGFTIVETMIFLAISGVTFLMAVTVLGNQQRTTQFNQSVNEFESNLNDIANDTATGVFPDLQDVECRVSAADSISFNQSPGTKPGENNKCVFVGKVVQLLNSDIAGIDPNYYVYTLIGINDTSATNFLQTKPVPLHDSIGGGTANFNNSVESLKIPYDTRIKRAYYKEGSQTNFVRGLAYVYSNFGNRLSNDSFTSGAASVGLYAVEANNPTAESSATMTVADFINSIDTQSVSSDPSNYRSLDTVITICLVSSDDRLSMIEVGSKSGAVTARSNFDISQECREP
jgi:hypothetical protein